MLFKLQSVKFYLKCLFEIMGMISAQNLNKLMTEFYKYLRWQIYIYFFKSSRYSFVAYNSCNAYGSILCLLLFLKKYRNPFSNTRTLSL